MSRRPLQVRLANGGTAYIHTDARELRRWLRRARDQGRSVVSVDGRSLPLDRLEDALAQEMEATR